MNPEQEAIAKKKSEADKGDKVAQYEVAMHYLKLKALHWDHYSFENYIQKAVDQGYALAQREYARYLLQENRGDENTLKVIELLYLAAKQNDSTSISSLNISDADTSMYQSLLRIYDKNQGYSTYHDSVQAKSAYWLAKLHSDELFGTKNIMKAISYYKKAADCNHVLACNELADIYYFGKDAEKNYPEAFRLFKKICDSNHPNGYSYYSLAWMYHHGEGTEKNFDYAIRNYEYALRKDYTGAALQLGHIYRSKASDARKKSNTWDTRKHKEEALKHFKSSEHDKNSQNYIGLVYEEDGDHRIALQWYEKSAKQNLSVAQYNLAFLLDRQPSSKDLSRIIFWYTKSAENNYASAQYKLSKKYEKGEGVKEDKMEAFKWCLKASENGNKEAKEQIEDEENFYYHYNVLYGVMNDQDFPALENNFLELKRYLDFEGELQHQFSDPYHLFNALDRRENDDTKEPYFQSYEFLGDGVLNASIRKYLFENKPNEMTVGQMSKIYDNMVNNKTVLLETARKLKLDKLIIKGESESNHRVTDDMLADHMEALIGAISVDSGLEAAEEVVIYFWKVSLDKALEGKQNSVNTTVPSSFKVAAKLAVATQDSTNIPNSSSADAARVISQRQLSQGSINFFTSVNQLSIQQLEKNLKENPHRANICSQGGKHDSILGSQIRYLSKLRKKPLIDSTVNKIRIFREHGADWDLKSNKQGAKTARQLLEKVAPEVRAKITM